MGSGIPLAEPLTPSTPLEPVAVERIHDPITFGRPLIALAYIALIVLGTWLLTLNLPGAGWIYGLWPTLPALVILYRHLARQDIRGALGQMLLAALWMTVGMQLGFSLFFIAPYAGTVVRAELVPPVLNGAEYVLEMDKWIQTGLGLEGDPRQFMPIHLKHFAIVGGSSLLSGGIAAFYFGALQMAYMNAYVWTIASRGDGPLAWFGIVLVGWHLWSIVRVASFITLATALSMPLYAWLNKTARPINWGEIGMWVRAAVALEIADIVLKAILAEPTRQILVNIGNYT